MNKQQLIERLAEAEGISRNAAKRVIDLMFQHMTDTLSEGGRVEIRDFGSFSVKEYDGYTGRNPKTGQQVTVPPKKLPFFKVGKELKERVDES